ncbi:hypothetical protein K9M06_00915, partial [Candidatus Bipolaricaulota bacterium]|nr:hypothetical protein [Candidatus Bipolaricaulota bacterium]
RILGPAHQELQETGFLKNVSWAEVDNGENDWYIHYVPGKRANEEIEEFGGPPYFATEDEKPALTESQERSVNVWVNELTQKLEDEAGENEGYYKKLAKLIVKGKLPENLVRQCLSEVKSEDQMRQHDSEAEQIENRSAYFTDLLKRRLKEKDKDLNELLEGV